MADSDRVVFPDEVEAVKKAQTDATSGGDSNSIEESPAEAPAQATPQVQMRNMIQVPGNCPPGYKMGADGVCREVFD